MNHYSLKQVKSCFNSYVLYSLEHCAFVWMSSAESHLGLLDSVVKNVGKIVRGGTLLYGTQKES